MSQPQEHKITTIEQLFEVANKDNVNSLIKDLALSIEYFVELKRIAPKINSTEFIWIDDGKNDINFKLT